MRSRVHCILRGTVYNALISDQVNNDVQRAVLCVLEAFCHLYFFCIFSTRQSLSGHGAKTLELRKHDFFRMLKSMGIR